METPVITTNKAKGAFPETHYLSIGVRGEPATKFLNESDTIFAIGASLSPGRFSHGIPNASQNRTNLAAFVDASMSKHPAKTLG